MARAALRSVRGSGAGAGLQAGDGAQAHWEAKKICGRIFSSLLVTGASVPCPVVPSLLILLDTK